MTSVSSPGNYCPPSRDSDDGGEQPSSGPSAKCEMIDVHAGCGPDPDDGFVPVEVPCERPAGQWLVEGLSVCDEHAEAARAEQLNVTARED